MSVYRRVSSTFSFITSSTSITSTVSLSTSTIVEITLSSPQHLIFSRHFVQKLFYHPLSGGKSIHDHETNPDLIDAKCLRQQMKERVINELTPISVIYEEEMAKTPLSDSATGTFPTNQELYQTFAKLRQKHLLALPQSSLFTIPDPFKLTADGKRFLLQVQQFGLQSDYSRNELIRGLCRKLMAQALMPNDTVLISYNEIRDEIQKLSDSRMEKLLNYFETQWMISIDTWNVSRTDTRTNSTCEGGSKTDFVLIIAIVYCFFRLSQQNESSNSTKS
ncbi:unnamed protein product [Rotaria sordida]|uniref:Uncharacterized protein n=1 Tax=Rotaria sordida TaxID=392033 RepID=A0A813YFA9_9BILA|nr:unnamed protein product [Rotaria sordida]